MQELSQESNQKKCKLRLERFVRMASNLKIARLNTERKLSKYLRTSARFFFFFWFFFFNNIIGVPLSQRNLENLWPLLLSLDSL